MGLWGGANGAAHLPTDHGNGTAARGINRTYSQYSRLNRPSRSGDGWVGQTGARLGTCL